MSLPEVVAHRGLAARAPENTMSAFRAAVAAGARHVECDVLLSQDGIPFLFHDRDLARVCGAEGALHERDAAELRRLRAAERGRFGDEHADEPLAELAQLVEFVRRSDGVSVFVEVKRQAVEAHGAARVLDAVLPMVEPLGPRCTLISFDLAFLLAARARTLLRLGAVLRSWDERLQDALRELRPGCVCVDLRGLPAEGALRHEGADLFVWEVADAATARALHARGVRYVESFDCARLLQELGAEAPR